jgi:endonuclease III
MNLIEFDSFVLSPIAPFSFDDWSRGYVFDRLFKISSTEYQKNFQAELFGYRFFWIMTFSKETTSVNCDPISVKIDSVSDSKTKNPLIQLNLSQNQINKIKKTLICQIELYLGLTEELSSFYELLSNHKILNPFIHLLEGYRLSSVLNIEWMPLLSYLTTNTTIKNYYQNLFSFTKQWGKIIKINGRVLNFPPLIKDLKSIREEEFRLIKLGYRAKYLPKIITFLNENHVKWSSKSTNSQEKLTLLTKQPGIGPYSARTTLLYGLREYSIPFVDVYIRKILHYFFNLEPKTSERKIYEFLNAEFAPYQGLIIDWLSAIYPIVSKSKDVQIKFQ